MPRQHNNTGPLGGPVTSRSRRRQTMPPVPPPGELNDTYAASLIPTHVLHTVKNVIRKTGCNGDGKSRFVDFSQSI